MADITQPTTHYDIAQINHVFNNWRMCIDADVEDAKVRFVQLALNYRTLLAKDPSFGLAELQARVWDCSLTMMVILRDLGVPIDVYDVRKPEEFMVHIDGESIRPQYGDIIVKYANGRFKVIPSASLATLFNLTA